MENNPSFIFPEKRFVYGSFDSRFGAAFLDSIILGLCKGLIRILVFHNTSLSFKWENTNTLITYLAIASALNWLYFALMESGPKQATLGKQAYRMIVVSENGERISFMNATGRYWGKILSTLIVFIGYFMYFFNDRKQTLHDKMARTLVIKMY